MLTLLRPAKLSAAVRVSAGQTRTFGVLNSLDMARKCENTSLAVTYSIEPPLLVETVIGNASPWSLAKMRKESPICFRRPLQLMLRDFALAFAKAGTARATSTNATAMIASNSFSVNEATRLSWDGFICLKEWPAGSSPGRHQ